jgi:hypothetical protein
MSECGCDEPIHGCRMVAEGFPGCARGQTRLRPPLSRRGCLGPLAAQHRAWGGASSPVRSDLVGAISALLGSIWAGGRRLCDRWLPVGVLLLGSGLGCNPVQVQIGL